MILRLQLRGYQMSASELKRLVAKRVELMAKRELADAQHAEAVEAIGKEMLEVLESIATCVAEPDSKAAPKRRTKPNTRRPDHDKIAKLYADFEPAASGCLCGCGEHVADDANFVNGHSGRLKSIALAVAAGKLHADKLSVAGGDHANAQGWWIMSEVCD